MQIRLVTLCILCCKALATNNQSPEVLLFQPAHTTLTMSMPDDESKLRTPYIIVHDTPSETKLHVVTQTGTQSHALNRTTNLHSLLGSESTKQTVFSRLCRSLYPGRVITTIGRTRLDIRVTNLRNGATHLLAPENVRTFIDLTLHLQNRSIEEIEVGNITFICPEMPNLMYKLHACALGGRSGLLAALRNAILNKAKEAFVSMCLNIEVLCKELAEDRMETRIWLLSIMLKLTERLESSNDPAYAQINDEMIAQIDTLFERLFLLRSSTLLHKQILEIESLLQQIIECDLHRIFLAILHKSGIGQLN